MQPAASIVVFCHLDDTLFEPRTLAIDASTRRAFERIGHEHVPLVFCSSKTRTELELIQQELGISQPFICENGAAVFIPRGYFGFSVGPAIGVAGYDVVEFGRPYAEVVTLLHRAADRLGIQVVGFSDMSVEEVALDCDVPLLQARLAKLREYSEPFRVIDLKPDALARLRMALRVAGLECTSRGRYEHVGAFHRDLGGQFLRSLYKHARGDVLTVAFGDSRGAAPLLRHADVPLVVPSRTSDETTHLLADVPAARLSAANSIGAWAEVILEIAGSAQHEA